MKLNAVNVISANNSQDRASSALDGTQIYTISFHAIFSDNAAAGTFKLQASNDPAPIQYTGSTFTPTNWVDIPNQSASVTSGTSALLTITASPYRWIRATWTRSAGAGTITVNASWICV